MPVPAEMPPSHSNGGEDNIIGLLWTALRWAIAAVAGGITTLFGFVMKQTWANAQVLSEIKHDTKNMRAMQEAMHRENVRRHEDLVKRIERLEIKL